MNKHFLPKICNMSVVLVLTTCAFVLLVSGTYHYHGRNTRSSSKLPREMSDLPEDCANLFSDTTTSLCTQPMESQVLCNVPLETCRRQTRPIQNMIPHIVTPLYSGHFDVYLEFLKSAIELVVDVEAIKWTVVVSNANERLDIMARFQKEVKNSAALTIKWWTLAEVAALHEGTSVVVTGLTKQPYISLKKIYGLLAADFNYALVTDAEYRFRRPTNITEMFLEFFETPWYWQDRLTKCNPNLPHITNAQLLLINGTLQDVDPNIGEEHLYMWQNTNWFFEKDAFASFIGRIKSIHGTVYNGIVHGTTDAIFADGAYYLYLLINRTQAAPHYRFPRVDQEFRRYNFTEDEMNVYHSVQSWLLGGMFEVFHWITPSMVDKLARIMNDYKVASYRYQPSMRNPPSIGDCLMKDLFDKVPTLRLQACSVVPFPDNCPNMTMAA